MVPAMTMQARRGSRRRARAPYHHGDLRAALTAEARSLLEEQGPALSLRSVARRLGVSQTALYHHFADKDALLAAVATEGFRELERSTRAARLQDYPLDRRIRGLATGYVRFAEKQPELFKLMYGSRRTNGTTDPALMQAATASFRALVDRITESVEEFHLVHMEPVYAAMAFWALSLGLASLLTTTRLSPESHAVVSDSKTLIDQVTRILVTGFAPNHPEIGAARPSRP